MTFSHCVTPAGFSGRCQSHVYPSPRQKVKSSPSSRSRDLPAAITTGWYATVVRHTIGRCQSHWRSLIPRDSSRRSLTGSTQSKGSLPWARHVCGRQLSTPWLSNRSPVTTALILVSSSFQKNVPHLSKCVLGFWKRQARNVSVGCMSGL